MALRNTDPNGEESVAPGLWLSCAHRLKKGRKEQTLGVTTTDPLAPVRLLLLKSQPSETASSP